MLERCCQHYSWLSVHTEFRVWLASSTSLGNKCSTRCRALVVHMRHLCKMAYIASQMPWQVLLEPNATIVCAFVTVQITRVLKDLCYMFVCKIAGSLGDILEPAHLTLSCQQLARNRSSCTKYGEQHNIESLTACPRDRGKMLPSSRAETQLL